MNYRPTSANAKTPPSGLGGVFDEGSANAAAEPDAFLTGLHPFGHIDHRVALVLDVVRQLGRAFEDVGRVVCLADHEPALGIDAAHELQDRHLGLPLRVQVDRALRVGLALLAADTRTNAPLQYVLHCIDFLSSAPTRIIWRTALKHTSSSVLHFQLPSNPLYVEPTVLPFSDC